MPDPKAQGAGFGVEFQWDIPLLDGYDWERVPMQGRRIKWMATWRMMLSMKPDAVLLTGWNSAGLLALLILAKVLRIPCIVRGESNALRRRGGLVRAAHRLLLRAYDAFLVIGTANEAFYRGYGISRRRLFSAPYFVDNERFARQAAELASRRDQLREAWGIPAERVCFLFAGKLQPKKRPLDLLAALDLAVRHQASAHVLIVGTGELEVQARKFVEEHDLPVTFAGFLNQSGMAQAYVAADVLAVPSDEGETWGLVVNEAMACGRPAIVSDRVGCGPDLIVEGQTGHVFPLGDVAALAKLMVALAHAPGRISQMGEAARARVLEHYSVEKAVKGTLEAVAAVCGRA
jgi:glycosyltransferase involved in cell wall biosynthesis